MAYREKYDYIFCAAHQMRKIANIFALFENNDTIFSLNL